MRYLVALGEDENNNKLVLSAALQHAMPKRDSLLLARVVEEPKPDPATILLDILGDDEEYIKVAEETKKKLEIYNQDCFNAGVECAFIVLIDDHAGNALCTTAKHHKIDCLVVGRRELNTFQRLLSFSTSKYCVDNAECNIIVVKKPYDENMPTEINEEEREEREVNQLSSEHPIRSLSTSASRIFTLRAPAEMQKAYERANPLPKVNEDVKEVKEEKKEIKEEKKEVPSLPSSAFKTFTLRDPTEMQKAFERANASKNTQAEELQESKSDKNLTSQLEEDERKRRVEELAKEDKQLQEEREERLATVKALEEGERQERLKAWKDEEQKEKERRKKESMEDRKRVTKLEEEERALRMRNVKEENEKENVHRKLERAVSLERLHVAEENERADRVRRFQEENIMVQAANEMRRKEETEMAIRLEDEEQARRIREDEKSERKRAEESKLDLQKVKEMEEEERQRRVARPSRPSHRSMGVQQ